MSAFPLNSVDTHRPTCYTKWDRIDKGGKHSMRIEKTLYPGGTDHVLTMSYDDGTIHDRRLVEIFDTYGIRGTFHLNSGCLGDEKHVTEQEVGTLYQRHEVSSHTVTHPSCIRLPDEGVIRECFGDRKRLEALCGYPVRGMSYPYGDYDDRTIALFRACGMEYSRTTRATGNFDFPEDPLRWHPTCHHCDRLLDRLDAFLQAKGDRLLYVWGHSYEFNGNQNWDLIEEFCKRAAGRENVWYATNIEILDYRQAQRLLRVSADCRIIYNPSATDVWIRADGQKVVIPAGKTIVL